MGGLSKVGKGSPPPPIKRNGFLLGSACNDPRSRQLVWDTFFQGAGSDKRGGFRSPWAQRVRTSPWFHVDKTPERENWIFGFEEEAADGVGRIWGLGFGYHVESVPWVGAV